MSTNDPVPITNTISTTSAVTSSNSTAAVAAAVAAAAAATATGVFWPAEFDPHHHAGCILIWPHNRGTFRLERARAEFAAVVRAIVQDGQESVWILCATAVEAAQELANLRMIGTFGTCSSDSTTSSKQGQVHIRVCPSNDAWARDTAPTFVVLVVNQNSPPPQAANANTAVLVGLDWQFNAYGGPEEGCYWPCEQDQKMAQQVCDVLHKNNNLNYQAVIHKPIPLVLEGGSIHTDGQGTILTTKECLLHPSRNPGRSQTEIQDIILQEAGCTHMIWLEHGLAHDSDTNGHIDNFACFVSPTVVVLAWTDDPHNDNYARCRSAQQILQHSTDARGRNLTLHKLYLPTQPMVYTQEIMDSLQFGLQQDQETNNNHTTVFPRKVGDIMAASYVNFYIANQAVIVPQFGDVQADARALQTLQPLFPTRRVVGVASFEILIGGGNIHCITQQIPGTTSSSSVLPE